MTSLTLTCIGRQQNTHDVVSWQLAPLSGCLPPVLAGQCITLHTEIDGQPECRAYTLSSSPQDACWQVTIKDVGRVSAICTRPCRWETRSGWMVPLAIST